MLENIRKMPLTLKEMENLSDEDRIVAYEEYYGRKIITPRDYKNIKDDMTARHEAMIKWEKTARCICDCGCEVQLRFHCTHKKTKKHLELMKQKSNND